MLRITVQLSERIDSKRQTFFCTNCTVKNFSLSCEKMGTAISSMNRWVNTARMKLLISKRREAHRTNTRRNMTSQLEAIEAKALASLNHDPIHPHRPYGLPEGMEGARLDIWESIFQQVDYDLYTIVKLREVCKLFYELLERRYVQARLPEVVEKCLGLKILPWTAGRAQVNSYAHTFSKLRTLSVTTKKSVDKQFDRGLLRYSGGSDYWSMAIYPHYPIDYHKIPTLMLGGQDVEQRRLQRAQKFVEYHNAPENLRAVIFDERVGDGIQLDLPSLRDSFRTLLEKAGVKITSFQYRTREGPSEAYANLRRFVALMPKLQELMIEFLGPRLDEDPEIVEPFPVCQDLKRYAEGPEGFNFCYLKEIFNANPTICGVQLGQSLSIATEVERLKGLLLETLRLTSFSCTCMPAVDFFGHQFPWMQGVRALSFWETRDGNHLGPEVCSSSSTFFKFVSSCKHVRMLCVSTPFILDTGGYLELPNLYCLFWKLVPPFKSLEFLTPAASLGVLALDVVACPELREKNAFFDFLREQHIPALFPALREIRALTEQQGNWTTVWANGATC